MDPVRKMYIVEGLDEIAITLKYEDKIKEYEEKEKTFSFQRDNSKMSFFQLLHLFLI